MATSPIVIIIGGPNGAGKSTTAPEILNAELRITEFVNADVIARTNVVVLGGIWNKLKKEYSG